MKFTNLMDLIQVFANEYSIPGNTVLILGLHSVEIKRIFEFIDSFPIFVNTTNDHGVFDLIVDFSDFPFEEGSFDLILNFTTESKFFHLLKPGGHILMQGEILNGKEYYFINNLTFSVL